MGQVLYGQWVIWVTACKPLPALLWGHALPALTNNAQWRNDRGAAAACVYSDGGPGWLSYAS